MTEFKVGDKVATTAFDATHGVVVFGPYAAAAPTASAMLVELSDGPRSGECVAVLARSAKPYTPTYAEGDVLLNSAGMEYTVVSGPYNALGGTFYVMQRDGDHYFRSTVGVTKALKPARTYEHNGVTYDLDAKYEDRYADHWLFADARSGDDTPVMMMPDDDGYTASLAKVVRVWGPLKRV